MTGKEKIVHRVTVGGQPMTVPRTGKLAMRKSRLMRRRFRNIFYSVGFLLSTAAISQASYGFLMEAPYFTVNQPQINGVSDSVRKELAGLVKSFIRGKTSILAIDENELQKQIALHPRVRDIQVDKDYPNKLTITAVERQEVAIAATGSGFYLIDNECHVMDKLDLGELARLDYPYISGLRAESVHEGEPVESASLQKALTLIQVLKDRNKTLYDLISEVQIKREEVSPLETLVMHMKGGLDVRLGDTDPVTRLPALETLLTKLKSDGVDPFSDLVYIDLSYDKLGFYMDRETALIVKRNQYDFVQREMQEASEEYAENHPQPKHHSVYANPSGGGHSEKKSSNASSKSQQTRTASASSSRQRSTRQAAPQARTPQAYQYRQPNYQQQRAAYQGYYQQPQQRRYYNPQAPVSMYNVPNQSR